MIGYKEERRGKKDGNWSDPGIIKNTDEFHQERKVPAFMFLDLMGHMKVKTGYRINLNKESQSNDTDCDQYIKSQ